MRWATGSLAAVETHPWIVLSVLMLVVGVLETRFTLAITSFQPDEIGYTRMAIRMGETLRPLALDQVGRDRLNQLYSLTLAPLYGLWGNRTAYHLAHVWNVLLMVSSAIPAYLLAKGLVTRRAVALLAALLVILAPWATIASAELTEVAAYPAAIWAFLAMTRSMTAPSPRRDALALAAIGLAVFARLQLVILLPLFVLAILVHELAFAAGRRDDAHIWSQVRRRLMHDHLLLIGAAVAVACVVAGLLVTGNLASGLGFYGNTVEGANIVPAETFDMARSNFVGIAVGLGVLPFVLALGGWIDAVLWPRLRAVHAFSVLCILVVAGIMLQVGEINARFTGFAVQERYVMYVAPLALIGALVAIERATRLWFALLAGTAAVAPLLATADLAPQRSAFWYLISPGLTTFSDVFAPRLGKLAAPFGMRDESRYALAALLTGFVVLFLALAARRVRRGRLVAVLGALMVAFSAGVTLHAFERLVYGRDGEAGLGGGSLRAVDWVTAHADGQPVSLIASQIGTVDNARQQWWSVQFWNRDVASVYQFGGPTVVYTTPHKLTVDRASGRFVTGGVPSRYVVVSRNGVPATPFGQIVATSPGGALELVRASSPQRAQWSVEGVSDAGWLPLAHSAVLRLFGGACGQLLRFQLPFGADADRTVRIEGARWRRSVAVPPGATVATRLPTCSTDAARVHVFTLATPSRARASSVLTPRLVSISKA